MWTSQLHTIRWSSFQNRHQQKLSKMKCRSAESRIYGGYGGNDASANKWKPSLYSEILLLCFFFFFASDRPICSLREHAGVEGSFQIYFQNKQSFHFRGSWCWKLIVLIYLFPIDGGVKVWNYFLVIPEIFCNRTIVFICIMMLVIWVFK